MKLTIIMAGNIGHDPGVVDASEADAIILAAKPRRWDRQKSVRTLA